MMKRMASGSCGGIAESGISLSSRNGWRQEIFRGFGITGIVADCGRQQCRRIEVSRPAIGPADGYCFAPSPFQGLGFGVAETSKGCALFDPTGGLQKTCVTAITSH